MARPRNLWRHREGGHGHTVWAEERVPDGMLYLKYRDRVTKEWTRDPLHHRDKERAKLQAGDFAQSLRTSAENDALGIPTLASVFAAYEEQVSPEKKGHGALDDRFRMDLLQHYFGDHCPITSLTPQRLKNYLRDRKAGKVQPGDRKLRKVSDTTAGNDVRFLQAVLRWAAGEGMIGAVPIDHFRPPRNVNPKRPVATYDRFLQLRPHCTGLFGPFMDLVESLGWRVGAIRQLRRVEVDLEPRSGAPFGRILKRGETDKRGVEMWVPLPKEAREAIEEALRLNPVVGEAFIFADPERPGRSWSPRQVYDRLRAAEDAAGLEHLERGAFHPYRRKWRRERKHLPDADVAAAGGWLAVQTLKIYDGADDETLLAVVTEPRKLREVK